MFGTNEKPGTGLLMRTTTLLAATALLLALFPATSGAALQKKISVKQAAGTELRNSPGDWVIGTANNNAAVWAQGPTVEGYRWAFVGGDYDGCAWISNAAVTKGGTKTADRCPPPERPAMSRFIGGNGTWWGKGGNQKLPHGSDGRFALVRASRPGCNGRLDAWANIHPIDGPGAVTGRLGDVKNNTRGGNGLRWRWISRDAQWVAVRDNAIEKSRNRAARHYDANLTNRTARSPDNWYFVRRDCMYLAGREKLPR